MSIVALNLTATCPAGSRRPATFALCSSRIVKTWLYLNTEYDSCDTKVTKIESNEHEFVMLNLRFLASLIQVRRRKVNYFPPGALKLLKIINHLKILTWI